MTTLGSGARTIDNMKNTNVFVAGSEVDGMPWERRALIEQSRFVAAWLPSRSEQWWADIAYAAAKTIPIFFAEPRTETLGRKPTDPVLMLCQLPGHFMHYVESLEKTIDLGHAFCEHDPTFQAESGLDSGRVWELLQKAQSPIERRLVVHLACAIRDRTSCEIVAQRPLLDAYRADFAISNEGLETESRELQEMLGYRGPIRIVVEADGHDFHERTKEQAARDKRRDRELQTAGWTVLRFTGTEIWRDVRACVEQIIECIDAKGGYYG
jgi:hypothetical protein